MDWCVEWSDALGRAKAEGKWILIEFGRAA